MKWISVSLNKNAQAKNALFKIAITEPIWKKQALELDFLAPFKNSQLQSLGDLYMVLASSS